MSSETGMVYEIFEISIVTILLILVIASTLIVIDIQTPKAKLIVNEISYISSLLNSKNSKIILNYDDLEDMKLKTDGNEIFMITNNKNEISSSYIGNQKKISQNKNEIIIET